MQIGVDPRIELVMTVQAASNWRGMGLFRMSYPYRDAAFALANRFADHEAARLYRELLPDGFAFDAPVHFALCHSQPPEFDLLLPYGSSLEERAGGAAPLYAFAAALRDFYQASGFAAFLEAWRDTHGTFAAHARGAIDDRWDEKLATYAGRPHLMRICLAPLSRGNYGPVLDYPDGPVRYAVIGGDTRGDPVEPQFADAARMEHLVLHEGAHGFVNPAIETCREQLDRSSALFDPIADTMRSQAYPGWFVVVCEHVVRAVVARLSADREKVLSAEEERGFRYIRAVAAMLAEYEENRDTFPDFWAFAPRIAAGLGWLAQEAGGYRG